MSLSVLWVPHETSVMARKRHSYPRNSNKPPASRAAARPTTNGPLTELPRSRTARSGHGRGRERAVHVIERPERAVHDISTVANVPFAAPSRPLPSRFAGETHDRRKAHRWIQAQRLEG